MPVFRVDQRADRGDFAAGDSAGLAWDVLRQTANHTLFDEIDLSDCPHLKPYAIACLCGLGLLVRNNGGGVRLTLPTDGGCRDHLCRLQMPAWFNCGPLPEVIQRATNLPLEQVKWPASGAAERIIEMLAPRAQLPPAVSPRMMESLDEIIHNALTHAHSPIDCVVVGQAFPHTKKVEVAILDLGQTIKGHLSQNPKYRDITADSDAIVKATEDGVTGTPDGQLNSRGEPNSGAGLAFTRDYCERGGGELTILSGDCWVTFGPGQTPIIGHLNRYRFQGCLVNVRYSTGFCLPGSAAEPIL